MTTSDFQAIGVDNKDLTRYLDFLDELRESGETNMFGARLPLMKAYPELNKDKAAKVLVYWMETFGERE